YASLAPAQQQALWRGAVLPAAQMTAAQRALLLAHTREPQRWPPLWWLTAPSPPEGLALSVGEPNIIRLERHGGITTSYLEVDGRGFVVRPDAAIIAATSEAAPAGRAGAGAAVATAPQRAWVPLYEEVREGYLEIRDTRTHEVVTVIELLSPTNKLPGDGR